MAHGITVNGCFILGLDRQTPAIFEQVLDFAMQVPLYDVQVTVLTPFPGTPLYAGFSGKAEFCPRAAGTSAPCSM